MHLLPAAWAVETPGAASGPALPDRVPQTPRLCGLMRRTPVLLEVVGSEVRDPRLVKRRCGAAEKAPRVTEEAAQGPQSQDRGQGGDSLPEDSPFR